MLYTLDNMVLLETRVDLTAAEFDAGIDPSYWVLGVCGEAFYEDIAVTALCMMVHETMTIVEVFGELTPTEDDDEFDFILV